MEHTASNAFAISVEPECGIVLTLIKLSPLRYGGLVAAQHEVFRPLAATKVQLDEALAPLDNAAATRLRKTRPGSVLPALAAQGSSQGRVFQGASLLFVCSRPQQTVLNTQ